METIKINKQDWDDIKEIINCAYNGNTDIKAVFNRVNKTEIIEEKTQEEFESFWKEQFLKVTGHWYKKEMPNMTELEFINSKERFCKSILNNEDEFINAYMKDNKHLYPKKKNIIY